MAGIDHKIRILKRSIATFHGWLDSCEELLKSLPSELESCKPSQLRELALKYKVGLCVYLCVFDYLHSVLPSFLYIKVSTTVDQFGKVNHSAILGSPSVSWLTDAGNLFLLLNRKVEETFTVVAPVTT